jgi:hypothetical protein
MSHYSSTAYISNHSCPQHSSTTLLDKHISSFHWSQHIAIHQFYHLRFWSMTKEKNTYNLARLNGRHKPYVCLHNLNRFTTKCPISNLSKAKCHMLASWWLSNIMHTSKASLPPEHETTQCPREVNYRNCI